MIIDSLVNRAIKTLLTISALFISSAGISAASPQTHAEAPFSRPSLILTITVEGLSQQYLDLLTPIFTNNGFKRLDRQGVSIAAIDYGPGIDAAAATSIIHTGAAPTVSGIPSALVYNPEARSTRSVLFDRSTLGNFTDETLSPTPLRVTSIADELRVDTDGASQAYAIAAHPWGAILPAAHTANGAYWLNAHTGNWASSTFYPDLHPSVATRNYKMSLASRLDTIEWRPLIAIHGYPLISNIERARSFRHTFPRKDFNRVANFINSPLVNTEITSLALDIINASRLGSNNATDFLSLSYSVAPQGASTLEILDSYLRLDRDLSRLFIALDRAVPTSSTLIILAGLPTPDASKPYDEKWNIPSGTFSIRHALSLLDMYLMAIYGNGDWVIGYHNRNFYLNTALIKQRDIPISQFRAQVAEFLGRMSGVCNVYTIDDIIASRAGDDPLAIRRNTSIAHSGDVIIDINPGWQLVDDANPATSADAPVTVRTHAPAVAPMFIIAPNIAPARINSTIDARRIAPTVARLANLRTPNGAALPPLTL